MLSPQPYVGKPAFPGTAFLACGRSQEVAPRVCVGVCDVGVRGQSRAAEGVWRWVSALVL